MASKDGRPGFVYRGVSFAWNPARKRYEGKVTVAKRADGTYDRRSIKDKDPAEIKRQVRALQAAIDQRAVPARGRKPSVREFFRMWIIEIAPHGKRPMRETTQTGYLSLCENWLFQLYGKMPIDDFQDVRYLDDLYAKMYAAGKAKSTVLKMHAIIRRGLNVARIRDLVMRNIAAERENPGSVHGRRRKPLTRTQVHAFHEVLRERSRRVRLRWQCAVMGGPRQGEALGLRWEYVDWERGGIRVDWQIQRQKYRHGCSDPIACAASHCRTEPCPPTWEHGCGQVEGCRSKPGWCPQRRPAERCRFHRRDKCPPLCPPGCTGHASRCTAPKGGGLVFSRPKALHADDDDELASEFVAMPKSWMAELKVHQKEQAALAKSLGKDWEDLDLLFPGPFGQAVDPKADRSELAGILTAIGVVPSGTHLTRRTAARLLRDLGIDATAIGRTLRQRDPRVTAGYIGQEDDDTVESASAMEAEFYSKPAPVTPARRTVAHRRIVSRAGRVPQAVPPS